MCGIFGIAGHNTRIPADVLERATQSLAHRGPDDGGVIILRGCGEDVEIGLGNRRLAILDLSPAGHQPMHDPDTGNWIVYNGEIYNFREVRRKLEANGLRFNTQCDTEMILKSYAQWGEKCLHEFRGMFAFALWDARWQCLFLARDPMGIKPLYYYQSDQFLIFSSEVRTLLETGLVPRRIDSTGLSSYLTFGSVYDPHTLIEGVRALPPGCYLTWQAGELKHVEYWKLVDAEVIEASREAGNVTPKRRSEIEAEVFSVLDESVRMQMVSDVPVGVFLSGGIDSSALVGVLSRNGVRPSTFSIVFREADYSEAEYSRAVAQQFHTDHHEITVSQADFFAAIDPAIRAMDLPTIDGINTYFVSQKTRAAGIKVALSGLGGDEIFAGYETFRTVPRLERFARAWKYLPAIVRSHAANAYAALAAASDQNRKLYALWQNGSGVIHPYFLSRMLFTAQQQDELLKCRRNESVAAHALEKVLSEFLSPALSLDSINRISYLEARCYMANTLLRDTDCMSMAHGLEVRVPLIDHQLARLVLSLPGSWKLNRASPKPLLVRALRGQLPERIVHRPKRGFALPFEHWLRDTLRPAMQNAFARIDDGPLGGMLNAGAVRKIWQDFLHYRTSWSRPWSLYVLQCWCEQYLLADAERIYFVA
jgi:asparagine synthase (glutamine-hydrolysing)